jgi:hypothetical protein
MKSLKVLKDYTVVNHINNTKTEVDGFWSSAISRAYHGKLKTHSGYKWSFVEAK